MPPKRKKTPPRQKRQQTTQLPALYEAEVLPSLKRFAIDELRAQLGKQNLHFSRSKSDQIPFQYSGSYHKMQRLRKVVAVYAVHHFAIPRPLALLGHQHLHRLIDKIDEIRALQPPHTFQTFRFSAAGKDSRAFTRLRDEIEHHCGLTYTEDEADLFMRIRPASLHSEGWEVLIRLTSRPLSVRPWRVVDMPGALNATIAAAMVELARPQATDRFLNLMCGSGTLLIERLLRCPAEMTVGLDSDGLTLSIARQNIKAAQLQEAISLMQADAACTSLPAASFDVICADLPWGQLVGSHAQNVTLYPQLLAEATRLAAPNGQLLLLTHQISLFENIVSQFKNQWSLQEAIQLFQGGLHPKLYHFRRG